MTFRLSRMELLQTHAVLLFLAPTAQTARECNFLFKSISLQIANPPNFHTYENALSTWSDIKLTTDTCYKR